MSENSGRAGAAEEPLERLRRVIECGGWEGGLFSRGVSRERLRSESGGRVVKVRKSRGRFRYVCLLTGVLAFVVGFVVGTLLPALLMSERVEGRNASEGAGGVRGGPGRYERVTFVREGLPVRVEVGLGGKGEGEGERGRGRGREGEREVGRGGRVGGGGGVVDGVYWGEVVEAALPGGYTEEDVMEWRRFTRNVSVVQIKEGCGRMQNRLLKFSDGTISCCRYRRNTDQIQGELFSYYLGQTLNLRNLVPTTLGLVQMRDSKWSSVRSEMMYAQWAEDKPVVLTKFIPNLITAFIPFNFRNANRRLHPTDVPQNASELTADALQNLVELAQWSDMIIFDYLTANLDRVVNNLYNLQWNFAMMDAPTHNLRRTIRDKLLIFLDNESGLLHGYRLLDKYESYHSALLDSLCVFRRSTATAIKRLHKDGNIGDILQSTFNNHEPEFKDHLPSLPEKSVQILNDRIARVNAIIDKCESMFPPDRRPADGG